MASQTRRASTIVIPAQAGIQNPAQTNTDWIPASAGMTHGTQPSLRRLWRARLSLGILPIRAYQFVISPLLPPNQCRFHPSCSQYALDALNEHGLIKGSAAAWWRILRCNPFGGKGFDPACDYCWFWEVRKRREVKQRKANDEVLNPSVPSARS